MLHREINVEVDSKCLTVWKKSWAQRSARITLLIDFGDCFVIVVDPSNEFWFLPGGGMEGNESIEETARREALEETGVEIEPDGIMATFHVTLVSKNARRQMEIPPFIVVHATFISGQLKTEYAPNRKIVLVKKSRCEGLLHCSKIPKEYECLKPYHCISKEVVRQFICATTQSK